MISRKLDGVRTLAINNHDEIEFYSRTGSLFPTLKKMNDEVKAFLASAKKAYGEEYVLDGETCIIKDNKDDFNAIMKEITRKNHLVADPRYILFDLIKRSEFENTIGNEKFATRMQKLEHLITLHDFTYLKIVEHQNSITENDFIA
jgi:ATP-dependent DNA ligase